MDNVDFLFCENVFSIQFQLLVFPSKWRFLQKIWLKRMLDRVEWMWKITLNNLAAEESEHTAKVVRTFMMPLHLEAWKIQFMFIVISWKNRDHYIKKKKKMYLHSTYGFEKRIYTFWWTVPLRLKQDRVCNNDFKWLCPLVSPIY